MVPQISEISMKQPGVQGSVEHPGMSINGFGHASSAAVIFLCLTDFEKRTSKDLSGSAIADALNKKYASIKEAYIAVFPPPPVLGLGTVGGFKLQLEDRGALGYSALNDAAQKFLKVAAQTPELGPAFSSYQINVPQINVDLDRTRAKQLGVSVTDIFSTLQVYLGSFYVNDFNRFGRVYQVRVQADAPFRSHTGDLGFLKTRNVDGDMVPLSSLVSVTPTYGPDGVVRYNGFTAADINSGPAIGYSSDEAQKAIDLVAAQTL